MVVVKITRLNPFIQRKVEIKESNLGKVLLFCEGKTEVLYFDYFAQIIKKHRNKYSELDIVPIPANGNAKRVLTFAEDFLSNDQNARHYSLYEKHLVFDCDAPKNIQVVIKEMKASPFDFSLLVSNYLFETWFLMHLEYGEDYLDTKHNIYNRLSELIGKQYKKASAGLIRFIIGDGDNIRHAISYAQELDNKYSKIGLSLEQNISQMLPYTTVHTIMERILIEMHNCEK